MTTHMSERRNRGGRPSKGKRRGVLARLSERRYDEFWQHVNARGVNGSDLAEQIFVEWLNDHRKDIAQDDPQPEQQTFDLEVYRRSA